MLCTTQKTEKAFSKNNFSRSRTVHYPSYTPPSLVAKRLRARAVSLLLILEFPGGNLGMETGNNFYVILILLLYYIYIC